MAFAIAGGAEGGHSFRARGVAQRTRVLREPAQPSRTGTSDAGGSARLPRAVGPRPRRDGARCNAVPGTLTREGSELPFPAVLGNGAARRPCPHGSGGGCRPTRDPRGVTRGPASRDGK